jgi:DNA-binding transcriptional LysR family regulator
MKERPTLQALAVFVAVLDHGTMTTAADVEAIAQPAISVHVRNLERYYGVPLLERSGRRVRPTPAGELVASYARQVLALVDDLGHAVYDLQEMRRGRLTVGASATVAETWLPRILGQYRRTFPDIELEVSIGNSERILHEIGQRRLGLAVVGRLDPDPDLEAYPVFRDTLRLFAAVDHPAHARGTLRLADLADDLFIFREPGSATRDFMLGCLSASGFMPTSTIQLGSNEAVKRAVAAGLGIGILSEQTLDVDIRAGDIAILTCSDWACGREFWLVHRRDHVLSRAEDAFRQMARKG